MKPYDAEVITLLSDPQSPSVVVQIVTFNSARWIGGCLAALQTQTVRPKLILVLDNGSTDDTCHIVSGFRGVQLVRNTENLGFARAHNLGFQMAESDFVLVLNPDVYLTPQYIERLVAVATKYPRCGAVTGKLLRMDEAGTPLPILDSTGIVIRRDRRAVDRGAAEPDRGQYDRRQPVFGVSAAAALYRRQMLNEVAVEGEVFDSDFFMYKEDIDLSWRARWAGWECYYEPEAVAYHYRGWREGSRLRQPEHLRIQGLVNRYLMLIKNDHPQLFLRHLPWILLTEVGIFAYALLLDRSLFEAWTRVIRLYPKMRARRRVIMDRRAVEWRHLRQWFR